MSFSNKEQIASGKKMELQLRFTSTAKAPGQKRKNTLYQSDAKGKENIIQSLTTKSQDIVSDKAPQKTTEQFQDETPPSIRNTIKVQTEQPAQLKKQPSNKRTRCGNCDGCIKTECGKCKHIVVIKRSLVDQEDSRKLALKNNVMIHIRTCQTLYSTAMKKPAISTNNTSFSLPLIQHIPLTQHNEVKDNTTTSTLDKAST